MVLQTVPAYISQAGYNHPAELDRNLLEVLFGKSGIARYGDFAVTGTGVAHQLQVTAGSAALVGVESNTQGAYFAWSNASELIAIAAPNASNPRIDTLLLRVKDSQYGTISGSPAAYWDPVQGVAGAVPSARPDSDFNTGGPLYVPGAWYRVADYRRNVGDTTQPNGQITRKATWTRNAGGLYVAENATDQAAITGMVDGDRLYRTDLKQDIQRQNGAWKIINSAPIDFSSSLTITATTVNPTKGNSTYASWYSYVGGMIHFEFQINIGNSGWAQGTGNYSLNLPVTADASMVNGAAGITWINDSGVAVRIGTLILATTTTLMGDVNGGTIGTVSQTWQSPDSWRGSIQYWPA